MKFWKKLQNPYALVAQGFVLGGLIFVASHSETVGAAAPQAGSILSSAQLGR